MHRATGHFLVLCFLFLSCVVTAADKPGFLEGHISIGPLTPVQRADGTPKVSPEVYATFKVSVFQADGQTAVTPLTPNAEGNFRQSLAPGTYVVDMPHGRMTKVDLPKTVTIVSDQTVHLDIDIDTGIR